LWECDKSNCNVGESCGNRQFADLAKRIKRAKVRKLESHEKIKQRKQLAKTQPKKDYKERNFGGMFDLGFEVVRTVDRGLGVQSVRSFEPGQIIMEYTGEVITQDECDHRMNNQYKNNEVCEHS